jgi:hypothetical protein
MEKTLTELLREYDQHTIEGTTPSKSWISDLLKEMRRSNVCVNIYETPMIDVLLHRFEGLI